MNIKRGGVYLAALDPVVGSEISKTRPVVVVSNEKNNEFSSTVTILPITSKSIQKIYPFEVFLSKGTGNLPKNSKANKEKSLCYVVDVFSGPAHFSGISFTEFAITSVYT